MSAGLKALLVNHSELIRSCDGMCDDSARMQMAIEQRQLLQAYNLMSGIKVCFESSGMVADNMGSRAGNCRMIVKSIALPENGGISNIEFNYLRRDEFETNMQKVDVNTIETSGENDISNVMKNLNDIEFEKSQLFIKYLYDTGLSAVSMICPGVSGIILALDGLAGNGKLSQNSATYNVAEGISLVYDGSKYVVKNINVESNTNASSNHLSDFNVSRFSRI